MTSVSNSSDGRKQHKVVGQPTRRDPGPSGNEAQRLAERTPSLQEAPSQFHGTRLEDQHVRLALFPAAIDEIARHTDSDTSREVGGVLLGHAYRHANQLFVDVRQALPAHSSDHGPIHFTFNADAWVQVHRDRETKFPGLDIVGWFHTHPGLGIFFSADDVVVHSAAFVLPWHVALVVDPLARQLGSFAWKNAALEPLPGIYEIMVGEPGQSRLPWRLVRGEIWDESYLEHLALQSRRPQQIRSTTDLAHRWPALVVAILSLLLSVALLVAGILPLRSQNESLQAVVTSLAHQQYREATDLGIASCPDRSLRVYSPLPGAQLSRGEEVTVVGTANEDGARRYALEVRPIGEPVWWTLGTSRGPVQAGQFLVWDTTSFAPGHYEMRLVARDAAGEALPEPAPCLIQFEIMTVVSETS